MWEEAVECRMMGGNPDQAVKLLSQVPEARKNSPRMLCVLGTAKKDPSYFTQAWEQSKHTYSRAQRCLARYHYARKEFTPAAAAFRKALKLSHMDLNSLVNLGFICMAQKNFEEAIDCYKKVVNIDSNQSNAWANLAVLYKQEGRPKQALRACQLATRKSDRNPMMLINLINIAFECEEYTEFVRATLRVIRLGKSQLLNDSVFKRLFYISKLMVASAEEDSSKIRPAEIALAKTEMIFKNMLERHPQRKLLWDMYRSFVDLETMLLWAKREIEGSFDKNKTKGEDENNGKNEELQTQPVFYKPVSDYDEAEVLLVRKRYRIMLKRAHIEMVVGWQDDLEKCRAVEGLFAKIGEYFGKQRERFENKQQIETELKLQNQSIKGFIQKHLHK